MSFTQSQAQAIQLLAMDVDGVLTTGDIIYSSLGEEIKAFNVKDGAGIVLWHLCGFQSAIITGRESSIVKKRAQELQIRFLYQGVSKKFDIVRGIVTTLNLDFKNVAYIGDDIPDLKLLQNVGISACPCDAVDEVKKVCQVVTDQPGGKGAVRELINKILEGKNIDISQYSEP